MQLDGQAVGGILVAASILLTFLASQLSTKAREQRRRLKGLAKRDIAAAGWIHKVQVWAAQRGYTDLPAVPAILSKDAEEDT
jgi:anti-sigma factor RsiW